MRMLRFVLMLVAAVLIPTAASPNSAYSELPAAPVATGQTQTKPPFDSYKGVTIGMKAADARMKLGKPKEDSEEFFDASENESARIVYDEAKTVRVMSITYSGNISSAPVPKSVIGVDIEAKPGGSMFKMVQFPKFGFWISYVRTGGDTPMVIITIQKMAKET